MAPARTKCSVFSPPRALRPLLITRLFEHPSHSPLHMYLTSSDRWRQDQQQQQKSNPKADEDMRSAPATSSHPISRVSSYGRRWARSLISIVAASRSTPTSG